MFRTTAVCFVVLFVSVSPARGQDANVSRQEAKNSQTRVLALLEASGEPYQKVRDSVWAVAYQGKHTKSIEVRVAVVEDLAVFLSTRRQNKF